MANPFNSLAKYVKPFAGFAEEEQQPQYEFYQPSNEMQNRFAGLLDNMPQPQEPSRWRKLGAALSGIGAGQRGGDAFGQSQRVAYSPYFNDMQEWRQRAPFMQQAADNERLANNSGLVANNQFRQRLFDERKLDEQGRQADDKIRIQEEKNRIAQLRAEAYDFKQRNPNWVAKELPGGNVVFFNPQNPAQIFDTGMSSGKMDERDRINLLQSGRMDVVNQQGINSANVANINQAGATQRNDADNATTLTVQGMPVRPGTGGGANSTNSPLNQARQIRVRAQEFKLRNPNLSQFITIPASPNAPIDVVKPGSTWFGRNSPTQEQYNSILAGLGLSTEQSTIPGNTPALGNPTPGQRPTNPVMPTTGVVNFEMGGRMYAIPANLAPQFIADNPGAVRK